MADIQGEQAEVQKQRHTQNGVPGEFVMPLEEGL